MAAVLPGCAAIFKRARAGGQDGRAWSSEAERASALPAFIEHYNWGRPHSACGGLPPMSRIVGVNNVMAHNT